MNRDQKAATIDRVAAQIEASDAIFAVDYRGISVKQASDLRVSLTEAGASFQIVKNTLTERAADKAGAESLKELLQGPTALAFVRGDAALAAKALATFRRQAGLLEFKGGRMDGEPVTIEQIESIARLPARDVLHGQFVGVLASPLTGLVRGLSSLISGVAIALRQIEEQGLIGAGAGSAAEAPAGDGGGSASEEVSADGAEPPAGGETDSAPSEAPGDPVAEAEAAEAEQASNAPSAGDETEPQEG